MAADLSIGPAAGLRDDGLEREQAGLLYERHARAIFGHCLRQLRNRSDAEDATQLTFLNAVRGLQRGVVPQLELPWLFAIANRVISNRRRSDSRRRRVETPRDLAELDDRHASPVVETDELVHLDEALAALPELQRRALLLREWQGLSYREIRHELELSQGAVEQLIFRARRSLARELTQPSKRPRFGRVISVVSLLPRLKAFLFDHPDGVAPLAKIALSAGTLVGTAAIVSVAVRSSAGDHHRHAVAFVRGTPPIVVGATPAAAIAAGSLRRLRLDSHRGRPASRAARAATEVSAPRVRVGEISTPTPPATPVPESPNSASAANPALAPVGTTAAARDTGGNTSHTTNGHTNAQERSARHTAPAAKDAKPGVRAAGSPPGSARSEHLDAAKAPPAVAQAKQSPGGGGPTGSPPGSARSEHMHVTDATPAAAPAKLSPAGGASGSADVPSASAVAQVTDGAAQGAHAAAADAGASAGAGVDETTSTKHAATAPPSNAAPHRSPETAAPSRS